MQSALNLRQIKPAKQWLFQADFYSSLKVRSLYTDDEPRRTRH